MAAADERQRVAAAGVAAAAAEARSRGLRVDGPVVLHDLFPLRVHWAAALRWFVDGIRGRTPH